jgi:hypothetical protein
LLLGGFNRRLYNRSEPDKLWTFTPFALQGKSP